MWKNIWIQSLPEGVDRFVFNFFFLAENPVSRGVKPEAEENCLPQSLSYIVFLFFFLD